VALRPVLGKRCPFRERFLVSEALSIIVLLFDLCDWPGSKAKMALVRKIEAAAKITNSRSRFTIGMEVSSRGLMRFSFCLRILNFQRQPLVRCSQSIISDKTTIGLE
jgi:hypothetical protein